MISLDPNAKISTLLRHPTVNLTDEEVERHNIFMLLTLSLIFDNWCIQRHKPAVREAYEQAYPGISFGEYVGHNIGATLVDGEGNIVLYSFNNNHLHNNSTEHAEARLVRKALRLANRKKFRSGKGVYGYSSVLQNHTVYTSLESCSQCSGIMDLANVATVVYAQIDPGQGHIGNVLYNMHSNEGDYGAPLPVKADFLPIFGVLEEAYEAFGAPNPPNKRPGMTSFLRSLEGYAAYKAAAGQFDVLVAQHNGNEALLDSARRFRAATNLVESRDALFGE